jgi:hypothetical protein
VADGRVSAHKWAVVAGVIVLALSALSFQAYAGFTGGDADSLSLTSAVITLDHSADFSIDATGVVPGDTVMRVITLEPGGDAGATSAIYIEVDASSLSPLFAEDTENALQLSIDICDEPWDETLDAGVPVDVQCNGVSQNALVEAPVGDLSSDTLANVDLTPGAENHLRVSLRLPDGADMSVENQSVTLEFRFLLVQRAPMYR